VLRETGERLLPDDQRGKILHAEHLARYRFTAALARGRHVLDAASGEGYGTAMLAAASASGVVGVDSAPEAVAHAREKYGLDYREADVAELPFPDASFDLVVSFETIEHVADADRALAEFRRVLSEDGILVVSTPNPAEYRVENPFHVREYGTEEFRELLRGHFRNVRLLYQQNWLLSSVLDDDQLRCEDGERPLELAVTKVAGQQPDAALYTIAVCGAQAPSPPPSVAVAAGVFELSSLLGQVRSLVDQNERLQEGRADAADDRDRLRRRLGGVERDARRATRAAKRSKSKLDDERRRRRAAEAELGRLKGSPGHRALSFTADLVATVRRRG
jgi:SAM-dependent methyltransferase